MDEYISLGTTSHLRMLVYMNVYVNFSQNVGIYLKMCWFLTCLGPLLDDMAEHRHILTE